MRIQSVSNRHPCLTNASQDSLLIFHLEDALLKSSSQFPYFMLVAFEGGGGGLLRALLLLLLYPFLCLLNPVMSLKIMVFVCFVGIKSDRFRLGSSVLHKFLLEDVGSEGFDVVTNFGRRVSVTELPRVMVESFLKQYIGVEAVVGRELKVARGYFTGLMEEHKPDDEFRDHQSSHAIFFGCLNKSTHRLVSLSKEVYLVTETEKRNWKIVPREKYLKPLIFHDGRLAFRPTPLASLVFLMWLPMGFLLSVLRLVAVATLPYKLLHPVTSFTGMTTTLSRPAGKSPEARNSTLYVCNHRTLSDPIYLSALLMKTLTAVSYGVSRFSETVSPIKTVRLTRNREKDQEIIEKQLRNGDLVICPEGTTCREPYLLRFSPLSAEIAEEIVPVAIDMQVSMFYGTTSSGCKCLDSVFHLMNPCPTYTVKILQRLPESETYKKGGKSKFEVANFVQKQIAEALRFEPTGFTRKEKYLILAGNEGIVQDSSGSFKTHQ